MCVCVQMSCFRWSQHDKPSPLQHHLPPHTHCLSVCLTVCLSAARKMIAMSAHHCFYWPVGVSGVMGVQVSLVRVSRTSWLFFPSLKIPRSTTHSLTHTSRVYFWQIGSLKLIWKKIFCKLYIVINALTGKSIIGSYCFCWCLGICSGVKPISLTLTADSVISESEGHKLNNWLLNCMDRRRSVHSN